MKSSVFVLFTCVSDGNCFCGLNWKHRSKWKRKRENERECKNRWNFSFYKYASSIEIYVCNTQQLLWWIFFSYMWYTSVDRRRRRRRRRARDTFPPTRCVYVLVCLCHVLGSEYLISNSWKLFQIGRMMGIKSYQRKLFDDGCLFECVCVFFFCSFVQRTF